MIDEIILSLCPVFKDACLVHLPLVQIHGFTCCFTRSNLFANTSPGVTLIKIKGRFQGFSMQLHSKSTTVWCCKKTECNISWLKRQVPYTSLNAATFLKPRAGTTCKQVVNQSDREIHNRDANTVTFTCTFRSLLQLVVHYVLQTFRYRRL